MYYSIFVEFLNMDHPNFIRDNLYRELIISMLNVTSHIYTYADSWMAAFASYPKLYPSHSRALVLICSASLLFNHNHHFCRVHDMFTPFNIFVQIHSLVRSHTYIHYVNALHHGNTTKTYRWSGIGAVALKASKSFRDSQKLQKASPDKDLSTVGIGTFALSKPSKTSPHAYYMKWLTILCSK
jgi:hypothetical protein